MKFEDKAYYALIRIKNGLKNLDIEDIKIEVGLLDGKKIIINCYQEIEKFIINNLNNNNCKFLKFKELEDILEKQKIAYSQGEYLWDRKCQIVMKLQDISKEIEMNKVKML